MKKSVLMVSENQDVRIAVVMQFVTIKYWELIVEIVVELELVNAIMDPQKKYVRYVIHKLYVNILVSNTGVIPAKI